MERFLCMLTLFLLFFLATKAVEITDIEDKIRNQRKSIEETARKLQESSRQQRMKHEEQLRSSRERIDRIKSEAMQRTRERLPVRETEKEGEISPDTNSKSPEVQEAFQKLHSFMEKDADQLKAENDVKRGSNDRASSTLSMHGVDDTLIQEIARMATSSVPRDHMIQHVAQHHPDKKKEDWNDIVIAALTSTGKPVPDVSDTDAALHSANHLQEQKFERSKASFEAKKKLSGDL